ncbi:F-box/kelch-repeat protein At3g06240-like [Euphorbia lathyris]|uniref:F-box/kelch-repeat protein At3g06240-like n=1 Tax=Euphorbia lathyris TaxID=212925 RepID=UPI00331358B3
MNSGSNMTKVDYIPDHLIADILSKLPSKSLLRFKTICKAWYSLISDPLFINLHSKQASQNPKILLSTTGFQIQILDYESSSFDDSCLSGPINVPEKLCLHDTEIIGSSCGLVCLDTDCFGKSFCIWNPSTRECRKIPSLYVNSNNCYLHGFGYDLVTNDFKLVISMDAFTYNVFSLKANSWKTITCPLGSEYYYHCNIQSWTSLATVINGIFHWIVVTHPSNCEILTLDVANETFEKLQLPFNLSLPSNSIASLFEHRGFLCVCFSKLEARIKEKIWMKKEYGGWIHLLTVKNPSYVFHGLPVLCVSRRNEVVLHNYKEFARYKSEYNKLDEIRIRMDVYGAVLYVETLVSPNAEDGDFSDN